MLVSVGAAIYSLILYLYNFKDDIKKYKPFWKFFSIKIVLFFSVWQRIFLEAINIKEKFKLDTTVTGATSESYIDNILISLEMFLLSIIVNKCYSYQEYTMINIKGLNSTRRNCLAIPKIL